MQRILAILKQDIKAFGVKSDLNSDEALITMIAAHLYQSLVISVADQALTQTKKRGQDG